MRTDVIWAVLWLAMVATPASGAEIEVTDLPGTDRKLITISGRVEPDDGDKFKQKAGFVQKAVVAFKSDGGSLVAGLEIGTTIRLKNYWTAVLNGADCASACAFAWLGGTRRFMGAGSRVGFHAAYRMQDGKASESGVGNALAGAYLANLGMSNSTVVYITRSAPTEISWLTHEAAAKLGIEVTAEGADTAFNLAGAPSARPNEPPQTSTQAPDPNLTTKAAPVLRPGPSRFTLVDEKGQILALRSLTAASVACKGLDRKSTPIIGKVAAREFAKNGMLLLSIVLEHDSGERSFINVDMFDMSRADLSYVQPALLRLVRTGRSVSAHYKECSGGNSTMYFLDTIQ